MTTETFKVGQWVELTQYGTAKVIIVWRDGSFCARLGDGCELNGLTAKHIRPVAVDRASIDILSQIEAL
jgi:hypothetical protein